MKTAYGDLRCKAIYYGDILVWAIQENGEYLNGLWDDSLVWDDNETWTE